MKTLLLVGMLQSFHLGTTELNNVHPTVEYGNFLYYRNSFEKDALAVFKKAEVTDSFNIRMGLTTGYSPTMIKDNKEYSVPIAFADNLALFVVPSYDVKINDRLNVTTAIVGNALAVGLTYQLN